MKILATNILPNSQLIRTENGLFLFESKPPTGIQTGAPVHDVVVKQISVSKSNESVAVKTVGEIFAENLGSVRLNSVGDYILLLKDEALYLLKPSRDGIQMVYLKSFSWKWKSDTNTRIESANFLVQRVSLDGKVDLVVDATTYNGAYIVGQSWVPSRLQIREEWTIDFDPYSN